MPIIDYDPDTWEGSFDKTIEERKPMAEEKKEDENKNVDWKAIATERIEKLDTLRKKHEETTTRLSTLEQQLATDAEKARIADEDKKKASLLEQGKYNESLKLHQETSAKERDKLIRTAYDLVVPATIKSALTKIPNLVPNAIDDVTEQLQSRIGIDLDTKKAYVRGSDGKPLLDDKGNSVNPDDFVKEFVEKRPYLKVDGMNTNNTSKDAGSKGSTGDKKFTAENAMQNRALADEWSKADPIGYKTAMRAYSTATRRTVVSGKK